MRKRRFFSRTRPPQARTFHPICSFGRDVFPSALEDGTERSCLYGREEHDRASASAPRARGRTKGFGRGVEKLALLIGREFDHAPSLIGVADAGENLVSDTKVRVAHVCAFNDAR
jgi:hypothetical protein